MSTEPDDTLTFPAVTDPGTIPFAGASDTGQPVTLDLPAAEEAPAAPPPSASGLMGAATFASTFPFSPIGDRLVGEMPGFDILPCGKCGAVFSDAPAATLDRSHVLQFLRVLAYDAGWEASEDYAWCCPACIAALGKPAAEWDDGAGEARKGHGEFLSEVDRTARATLTAGGRYPWDYEAWRERFRPRPEKCVPEPVADRQAA